MAATFHWFVGMFSKSSLGKLLVPYRYGIRGFAIGGLGLRLLYRCNLITRLYIVVTIGGFHWSHLSCHRQAQSRSHCTLPDFFFINTFPTLSCSAFAAQAWRVGLGDALPPFNATEQVPRDNFMMAIFNGTFWSENNCPGGILEPDGGAQGTLCQVSGQFKMPFGGYNSIKPYDGMNSHCGSQWPSYVRCEESSSAPCQC